MKKNFKWFAAAVILFLIFGFTFLTVQQAQRNDANSPQIQMAEDAAAALNTGTKPSDLTRGHVDMAASLAPFTIIYNKTGAVVSGSGYLNGSIPTPPLGVLTASTGKEYSFVSWQPQGDVRIAAVTTTAKNYYVLSGRSLKEVEKNENKTFWFAFMGGVLSELVLAAAFIARKA
ncbi:MAG TPA: hypothetical protein VG964_03640 [Candidatus Saccharimonadales bacterium]|nr:hypothetical protein [Candidatus Saccharimonadales bacterium]